MPECEHACMACMLSRAMFCSWRHSHICMASMAATGKINQGLALPALQRLRPLQQHAGQSPSASSTPDAGRLEVAGDAQPPALCAWYASRAWHATWARASRGLRQLRGLPRARRQRLPRLIQVGLLVQLLRQPPSH